MTIAARETNTANTFENHPYLIKAVAKTKEGIVTISPVAVTNGAAILSRSHSFLTQSFAKKTVTNKTIKVGIIAPIIEIKKKSNIEITSTIPNASETILAMIAKTNEQNIDNEIAAARFCPTPELKRLEKGTSPNRVIVDKRQASAPKTLPRRPSAAGAKTTRPGNSSKISVKEPKNIPAANPAHNPKINASNPVLTLARSVIVKEIAFFHIFFGVGLNFIFIKIRREFAEIGHY